ncbi:MAG: response regulator transcription factor [Spirochaetaceae bacterium]|nr:response regulator transcription factor [Spirochaetaceae bacterium]
MSKKHKILVIEDEDDIRELIAFNLELNNMDVLKAKNGEQGIEIAEKEHPDIIILDLMLPGGIDGFEVCRYLKKNTSTRDITVIMLTARAEDPDVVTGFEIGADDYITKPFSPRILIARINATLRRKNGGGSEQSAPMKLKVHNIIIDIPRHEVYVNGEFINLSVTEFEILKFLASSPGWVFSRNQIIDSVKGANSPTTLRSVDVQILGLRKKLGNQGRFIETIRGVGYRMQPE